MINTGQYITSDSARRKVNGYLTMYVSMALIGADPVLVTKAQKSYWRVSLHMRWPGLEGTHILGQIDVNARTRTVVPLDDKEIRDIQVQLNVLIAQLDGEQV